jgi:hypothetical protein
MHAYGNMRTCETSLKKTCALVIAKKVGKNTLASPTNSWSFCARVPSRGDKKDSALGMISGD